MKTHNSSRWSRPKLSVSFVFVISIVFACFFSVQSQAQESKGYIVSKPSANAFTLSASGISTSLYTSSNDYPGVLRVLNHLQADIQRVTEARPDIMIDKEPAGTAVIVGTISKSTLIDQLVKQQKLSVEGVAGKREVFILQIIEKPFPNVERALVIAGSDKRGTIYGVYDLSKQIGVSPWYWWADVPSKKQSELYVLPGRHTMGEPAVKYRGIFINDEAPALSGWSREKFGGFNHKFYEHVFELILRLKGNFLWPAMWGSAFYDDDPENPRLADEYGVVVSTSHHEPLMRAHDEWRRYGSGPWNYQTNASTLQKFWSESIKRTGSYESVITLGMRGDGDEPMSEQANIALLEKIVKDQRDILQEVTGKDVTAIPQVWALYKEVQEYYDRGMRVPDDVTLLLCDDNWGNIRKLPNLGEKSRKGGYGIYYHFDFVGGPRNYKWLNTSQVSRVWDQMHLAYEYGAREIWIVNVGDIKPMELPISFFLDYAWNPEAITAEQLPAYTRRWAEEQFGTKYAQEVAELLTAYTTFNSRRKPEMLAPNTYSLVDYREFETVVTEYNAVAAKAQRIYDALAPEYKAAFYQLVLHPTTACANLNELYYTVGKNHLYAEQGRAATNSLAQQARKLYDKDSTISHYYNNILAGGKWSHMMDQTHIGYTSWQQPDYNSMPAVKSVTTSTKAEMGIAIEGSVRWWPYEPSEGVLPDFDIYNQQVYYLEIFNRGATPFEYSAKADKPWIQIHPATGKIADESRVWVSVDWAKAPTGTHRVPITVSGAGNSVVIQAVVNNPESPTRDELIGFAESNGYVSIEAEHYSRSVEPSGVRWQKIPNLGRTRSGMTIAPVAVQPLKPGGDGACLEYQIHFTTTGTIDVTTVLSPTLNFKNEPPGTSPGLRYAISIDDEQPVIVGMHEGNNVQDWRYPRWWNEAVSNNAIVKSTKHTITKPGMHVLKFWAVDPGVILQKIVIDTGKLKHSYLGPPESYRGAKKGVSSTR